MPNICCRCNTSGRCKNYSCKKMNSCCLNCQPLRLGRCENAQPPTTVTPSIVVDHDQNDRQAQAEGQTEVNTALTSPSLTASVVTTPTCMQSQSLTSARSSIPHNPQPSASPNQPTSSDLTNPQPINTTSIPSGPNFTWGTFSGTEMVNTINRGYDEVIHWRPNVFLVPPGTAGNSFVQELARLLQAFADGSSMECVCMKAITILQVLVLQKPSRTSKTRDHIKHLKRRMELWKAGSIAEILQEGRCIQNHLPRPKKHHDKAALARTFQRLMTAGKVKALRLLSSSSASGILDLDEVIPDPCPNKPPRTTRDILIEKHPQGKPAPTDSLLQAIPTPVNPILFENLNEDAIQKAALKPVHGAAGLSGLDAHAWRKLCSSFNSSKDLCSALANVGRRLCTSNINPDHLSAFVACRLIPLNKCPGVRPIGIGEVHRRIIAKTILGLLKHDIQNAAGPLQVCAGQESGFEAAIHAMHETFADLETEGALLVDATNAFNSVNRQAALHNISVMCPSLSQVLTNTYQAPVRCVVQGNGEILSTEGTTQGDPLAMAMYALAVRPLIDGQQAHCPTVKQVWYTDDATGAGTCSELRAWWDSLLKQGQYFGYHPNECKTHLIVKEEFLDKAK